MPKYSIEFGRTTIIKYLNIIMLLLVMASLCVQLIRNLTGHDSMMRMVALFDVNAEANIPTFFSVLLLMFACLLLKVIAHIETKYKTHWIILSVGFLFMSLDEFAMLHDKLTPITQRLLGTSGSGVFYFAWIIPAIILICILAIYFYKFLFQLPKKTRISFILSGSIYLAGAIGMELVGGHYLETHSRNLTYMMIYNAEETLEMLGSILFIDALLAFIIEHHADMIFKFVKT